MQPKTIVALLLVGIVLAVISLLMRVHWGEKYEIKTIDLVFIVIPLLLVAIATGRLKGLDLFGVKADLSALWTEAAQAKIEGQLTPASSVTVQDAVIAMEMASKGGIQELRHLIERNTDALEFKLGHGGYYGPAIRTYFEALSGSSHLRTVVVNESDGTLFGIYNAPDLIGYLRIAGEEGYTQFQQYLNAGDATAEAALAQLPGFVGADQAVTPTTSKRDALAKMEALNTDRLPVIDDKRHFLGTLERSKLVAGLILIVTDKLEGR